MTRVMGNGHADHPRPRTLNFGDGSAGSPRTAGTVPTVLVADVRQLGQGAVAQPALVKGFDQKGCPRAIELVDLPGAAAAGKGESA